MQTVNKKNSLRFSLIRLLLLSIGASVCFFLLLNLIGNRLIDAYYLSSGYQEKKSGEYIGDFQEYVMENQLSTEDLDAVSDWVDRQKVVFLQLYQDGILIYDSSYRDTEEIQAASVELEYLDWGIYYDVRFTDGMVEAVIDGSYAYQMYNYAELGEIVLSLLLFIVLVAAGIGKKVRYILKLGREIGILESGNLDYPITVSGKDELAALAGSLDEMRRSFRQQVKREADMVRENQKIITEMSHDLRTPLTAILLYTEILKKEGGMEGRQMEYVEKIHQKARRMKQLTDHLFEYSLVTGDMETKLEAPEACDSLFYDLFSETCSYLEEKGFQVRFQMEQTGRSIRVDPNYLSRIMDNITSNLIKYADSSQPVLIGSIHGERKVGFFIENAVGRKEQDGTGIGLQSMKSMMVKMGGSCRTEDAGDRFRVEITFPAVKEEDGH